jgi:glycosyltransferase involved in cell wall biosynthesis
MGLRRRTVSQRLAVLFDRIGPYHHARLGEAGKRGELIGIELFAGHEANGWSRTETTGYERCRVFPARQPDGPSGWLLRRRLAATLAASGADVVAIPGWGTPGALSALSWCCASRTPAIVMSDSWDPGTGRRWWREQFKRQLVSLYASGLVAGAPQRRYLQRLGMPPERILTGYDAVDNAHFAVGADRARQRAPTLRSRWGLPRHYFLCTCRMVPEKNLPRLLEAYAAYRSVAPPPAWDLVLVGDGPLGPKLRQRRDDLDLRESVHFMGFQPYDKLPLFYGLAEAFVLPSISETWGLVVNEAMAAGLPVLVSRRCGCAEDLVAEGRNGFCFDPFDLLAMRDALRLVASAHCDRRAMGQSSREVIGGWSLESFAEHLWWAAHLAANRPTRPGGPLARLLLAATERR